jgi:hypothetical protein
MFVRDRIFYLEASDLMYHNERKQEQRKSGRKVEGKGGGRRTGEGRKEQIGLFGCILIYTAPTRLQERYATLILPP